MTLSRMIVAILLAASAFSYARAEDEVATHRRPVKVVADARIAVGNQGTLPLYVSNRSKLSGIQRLEI
jgi:hypothetical protein